MVSSKPSKLLDAVLILMSISLFGAIIIATDILAPPYQYKTQVYSQTFKNGNIRYIIPYTGGGVGACNVSPELASVYPVGSEILISKTINFYRCSVAPLPGNWTAPRPY